jgi:hypothetical protein
MRNISLKAVIEKTGDALFATNPSKSLSTRLIDRMFHAI